ncbi:MAG: amidohydrolase family protein [Bacteroidetes bacterium]|nr:amidohydrolase family protein [Bacteroidota bacterium]MBS1757302.1 amidohydrolase family protein [Bacteroidota bacterium]
MTESGFSVVEVVKFCSLNAEYLRKDKTIDSVEIGKDADLVLINVGPGKI